MSKNFNGIRSIKLPSILILVLIIPLFFGKFIPNEVKAFFYAVSLTMKAILIFITPFIIFSFLFSSLSTFKSGVIRFVSLLVFGAFISNFIAICTGFAVSIATLPKLQIPTQHTLDTIVLLQPLWEFSLPKLISNEAALISGFILGIFFSIYKNILAETIALKLSSIVSTFLKHIFVPLLPIFILGFVFKLEGDQLLAKSLKIYGPVFFIIIATQICYLLMLYMIAANFSLKRVFIYIKNILPAMITGFSTISSMATMPMLIVTTEKNLNDASLSRTIIPATINIHTLGSALGLILLSYATLLTFDNALPSTNELLKFAFYYAIAKFAVVAVPGGVLIIICPLLETYLGFSGEMTGLITAIYMLIDPFGTAANVAGNGAFAIIFSKLYKPKPKRPVFELFRV